MAGTAEGTFDAIADLVHDDFVSRGRNRAVLPRPRQRLWRDACAARQTRVAGQPRLVGSGNTWVMMMPLRYGTDILHYVAVLEVEDGRIRRATGHWAAPFPAQEYRAEFADRR
jgi:hypothetical protein